MKLEIQLPAVDKALDIVEATVAKVVERNHVGNLIEFLKQEAKNAARTAKGSK